MIVGITNIAGSGKTLTLTRIAKQYDIVICNYKLNEEYFKRAKKIIYVANIEDFFKYKYHDYIRNLKQEFPNYSVILAVDEAGLFFPRLEYKKMDKSFLYLFNQHRKLGIDLYFTVQDVSLVHRALVVNTAYWYYVWHIWRIFFLSAWTKYNRIGMKGSLLWRSMFIATDTDYKSYDTKEMLAGADWYLQQQEEVKQGKIIIPAK